MKKSNISLSFVLLSLLNVSVMANTEDFGQLLDEVTELATKTRLNIDYVPGTMSVIKGNELKALGITNLSQPNALDALIGFEGSTLTNRGIGAMYGDVGSKIKWMLNGKVIPTFFYGSPLSHYPIATDMIDRIEYIRGPGSSLYGENAVFGIINIVLKKEHASIFTSYENMGGSHQGKSIGANVHIATQTINANISAFSYQNDGGNFFITVDGSQSSWGSIPYTPGKLPSSHQGKSFFADIDIHNINLWFYYLESKISVGAFSYYTSNCLPPEDFKDTDHKSYIMSGMSKTINISNNLQIKPKIEYVVYENKILNFKYPPDSTSTHDYLQKNFFKSHQGLVGLEVYYTPYKEHKIVAGKKSSC